MCSSSVHAVPFFISARQMVEREACVGSSEAYPSGKLAGSRKGSEEGELGLGESAAEEEEWYREEMFPMLALFFMIEFERPSVSLTPKILTPAPPPPDAAAAAAAVGRPLTAQVLELWPLLLQ